MTKKPTPVLDHSRVIPVKRCKDNTQKNVKDTGIASKIILIHAPCFFVHFPVERPGRKQERMKGSFGRHFR